MGDEPKLAALPLSSGSVPNVGVDLGSRRNNKTKKKDENHLEYRYSKTCNAAFLQGIGM